MKSRLAMWYTELSSENAKGRINHHRMDANEELQDRCSGRLPSSIPRPRRIRGRLTMKNRLTVCVLTTLSVICGAAFAAQLTPAEKIDRVTTLLKSLETRDLRPLAYIGSSYTQHNRKVADGPAGFKEVVLHLPAGTKGHTGRIFADGDYGVAQTDYNLGGPKVGFDVFRFDGDNIVEHWDNLQDKCAAPNPSGRTQLDGPTKVTDLDKTGANKSLIE